MQVIVYKSLKKDLLYLFVTRAEGLSRVPEALMERFGEPAEALSFDLTEDRKLGKEDPAKVLANLDLQGYHLQLPPAEEMFRG